MQIGHVRLSSKFEDALRLTWQLHGRQTRKGSEVPYLGHLLGTAALVIDDGGSEDEVIAALLHDAVEDQGGKETLEKIRVQFGETVARIVESCSDTDVVPKPAWRERKEKYLKHLRTAPPDVLRVSLADKVYNARAILMDLGACGEELWGRFNAGKGESLWYYRQLADIFAERLPGALANELSRTVSEIERMAG